MKRSAIKRRTRLRARSPRRQAEQVDYLALVRALAEEDDRCEVGPILSRFDPTWRGCRGVMSGLHHIVKRSAWRGGLLVRANVIRSCSPCNQRVEDFPLVARRAGLVRDSRDRVTARVEAWGCTQQRTPR